MNYTSILRRAGEITWRYRALWLFGVLLAIFGGGGGGGNGGNTGVQYRMDASDLRGLNFPPGFPEEMIGLIVVGVILLVIAVLLILAIVGIVVANTARGALIGMVDEVERTGSTSVSSGFRTGWARFLRIFAIGLVIGVPAAVVLITLLLLFVGAPVVIVVIAASEQAPALAVVAGIAAVIMFLLWLLAAIVTGAAIEVLSEVMYRRCVLEQEGVFESIREGYRMVRRHPRDIGLTWLILFGINLAFGVVMIPVSLLALGLAAAPGLAVWAAARSVMAGALAALPFLLIAIAALVVVQGIYLAFRSAVWTLVYREIATRGRGDGGEAALPEPAGPAEA